MPKYKESSDISHYQFINPHDRMYRDCLKNVDWRDNYSLINHLMQGLGLLFLLCGIGLLLLLLSF